MNKHQLRIDILGTTFTIQSDENPEYLKSIYDFLKHKINEIKQHTPSGDPLRIALLACLNVIDELFRERESNHRSIEGAAHTITEAGQETEMREIEEIAARIIKKIDEYL